VWVDLSEGVGFMGSGGRICGGGVLRLSVGGGRVLLISY
jgi:hypothetical protein